MFEAINRTTKKFQLKNSSSNTSKTGLSNILTTGNILLYLAALIPALLILIFILKFTVDIPFWDEWEFTTLVVKLHTGGFSFNDFWLQHNEHRIVFLRVVALGLAALGGWDINKEVLFSYLVIVGTFYITWLLLKSTVATRLRASLTLICSLLIFNPIQHENLLWGFQMSWFLVNLLLVSAVFIVNRWPGTQLGFLATLVLTLIATYTASMGISIWACIMVGLIGRWQVWKVRYILTWVFAALISISLYFYNYTFISTGKESFYFLKHPLEYVTYILNYLASPWAGGDNSWVPILSGVGLLAVVGCCFYLWWLAYKAAPSGTNDQLQIWYNTLPWSMIVIYVLLNAMITGYARVGLGVEQAGASRYTTLTLWFWIASFVIIVLAVYQLRQRRPRLKLEIVESIIIVSLIFLSLYVNSYITGYNNMENWNKRLGNIAPFLHDYPTTPDAILLGVYPSSTVLRQDLWTLDQYHESIFGPQKLAERNSEQAVKLNTFNNPAKKLYTYPSSVMKVADGNTILVNNTSDSISFKHSGPKPTNIFLDSRNFDKQQETSSKDRTLYIQADQAWYAYIYIDTGKGFNQNENELLYPVKDINNHPIFITNIPKNLQSFRIDLYYSTGREIIDSLKVATFEAS